MRTEEIRDQIRSLDRRNLHLWFAAVLAMFGVATGFIWLVLPGLFGWARPIRPEFQYRPEAFFGVIALMLLFNIYMVGRRKMLHRGRDEMVRELVRAEAEEMLALLDPVTELFNRRFLDRMLPKEASYADRYALPFAIVIFDIADFSSANKRLGAFAADGILVEVAKLLTRTFRPSDLVIRYGGDEFLVLMPSTDEAAARRAVERLTAHVELWNQKRASKDFRLRLAFGLAVYSRDASVTAVLGAAEQSLYFDRSRAALDSPVATQSARQEQVFPPSEV